VSAPSRSSHRPTPLLPASLLLVPLFIYGAGCKVDKAAFESRIFSCDTTAPDPLCGTDADGTPMTCFSASQIGGSDFCVKSCGDTPMSLPQDDAVCVQGGAELQFCSPSQDFDGAHPLGACGRADLGCLRTNVETGADEGVCITGSSCTTNDDCHDPVKSTCAATFLRQLYAQAGPTDLEANDLYCLQEGCKQALSACSPGEVCLPLEVPPAANAPDICVPKCDSHGRCPPTYFCLSKISGAANPDVCIPGLLGFVCETDVDCLVGKCRSDNPSNPTVALNLCTTSCTSDADCAKYDSDQGLFFCSAGPQDRHCVTPSAYTGALCRTDADCATGHRDQGTKCSKVNPGDATGTCLYTCNAQTPCAPRDGVGHTCLPFYDDDKNERDACIPGVFPYPCFADSQCAVPDLQCAGADGMGTPGNCTHLCTTDADCQNDIWTAGQAYCGAPSTPVCLPLGPDGAPCTAPNQCASKICGPPASGSSMTNVCGGKS
jgi:hypothetical protein